MPITDPVYNTLAAPGIMIADRVFELLVQLDEVDDMPESPEETVAISNVERGIRELTEPAEALAKLIGWSLPPLGGMPQTIALAQLFALVLEARRRWRGARFGPDSKTTMVEGTPFADFASALQVFQEHGGTLWD